MQQLNLEQLEAVQTLDGPLLVLAGAGSGKTRVVTLRIIQLIARGIHPSKILGLTFTNKAAEEMRERIKLLTDTYVQISTFHSLGAFILRESIHWLGYSRDFTIYDEQDTEKLLKACISDLGLEGIDARRIQSMISQSKNSLRSPEEPLEESVSLEAKFFPGVFKSYQAKLHEYNALDFDDLLYLPVRLLREIPEARALYQDRWSHLLIDEYQDTNQAQYTLVRNLVEKHQNLCVVGDPDQSIYSWRGANVTNILNFEHDYPGAKIIRLEQNYRSRSNILEAANALISNNAQRYKKVLWSDRGPGELIKRYTADTDRKEAEYVAERIRYHYEHERIPLNQMVVFYRTNAQSRVLEDQLLSRRVPYVIIGGISFYQRKEIKDILAFLRMVHSGADLIAFMRTINLPKRGIGEATLEKIHQSATKRCCTILAFCERLANGENLEVRLSSKQKEGVKAYVSMIHDLQNVSETSSVSELVKQAIEKSDYLKILQEDKDTFEDRRENINALIAKALEWESSTQNPSLEGFLEELALKSSLDEADHTKEKVHLMTIHNGKGLEFTITFIVGLEEDLFPHVNSREDELAQEEERRLCYVGMTRAKEVLYLCEARERFLWGTRRTQRSSRFFREIPHSFIERVGSRSSSTFSLRPSLAQNILRPGDAVFHREFGAGVVELVYEGMAGLTYQILFSKDQKSRSLVAKLASLTRL